MSGHIGLREESCAGHLLAQRIAQLFRGPVLVAGTKLSSLGDKPCLRCVHGTYPVTIATNRFLGFGVCIGPLPVQCFMDRRSVCYSTGAGCAVNVSTSQRSRKWRCRLRCNKHRNRRISPEMERGARLTMYLIRCIAAQVFFRKFLSVAQMLDQGLLAMSLGRYVFGNLQGVAQLFATVQRQLVN